MNATHTTIINGQSILVTLTYTKRFLGWRVTDGTLSEQCDGCGTDIAEGCNIDSNDTDTRLWLACDCGATYHLRPA